ncbi:hypothetical protein MFLAVUS_008708 [Mucor flavus]|uniref:Uncharacterized protein n=1 Tax=Mucor flavus TaxID=439312 RepID=A0ABP9Z811_9FUNG
MQELEEDNNLISKQGMQEQENVISINDRLSPHARMEPQKDYESVISLEDFEGIVEETNEPDEQLEGSEDMMLNLLDLGSLGLDAELTEETTNGRWTLTQEIKSDAWEYDTRNKKITEEKRRNGVLLKRMAVNIVKLCHEQVNLPTCEAEYARLYLLMILGYVTPKIISIFATYMNPSSVLDVTTSDASKVVASVADSLTNLGLGTI